MTEIAADGSSNSKVPFLYSGMLSDVDIKRYWGKGIKIHTDYKEGEYAFDLGKQLSYGSIDLRLNWTYRKFTVDKQEVLTYDRQKGKGYTKIYDLQDDKKLIIQPGEIILANTFEIVELTEEFAGILTGRSSFARLGIMIHCCQEFINPGHGQTIPLQIINMAPCAVELDARIPICQLVLFKLMTPASNMYKNGDESKYAREKNHPMYSQAFKDKPED